jgi:long-chain fatty acid transport protein
MKAKGMGGAATATSEDTFGGANNPASMIWIGNRIDFGADLFSPQRGASRTGSAGSFGVGDPGRDFAEDSDKNYFVIPEFGYNRMLNSDMALGVTVYGNGGMNTQYPGQAINSLVTGFCDRDGSGTPTPADAGVFNGLCGSGKLGVDLMQLVIAPTFSYKLTPTQSIGVSPLIGYQRFKAYGIDSFAGMTASGTTANLTDQGYDSSAGFGVRIGWMGRVASNVTLGAAYSTKVNMGKLDKYKELFAEGGDFDIPENYNVGVAMQVTPEVLVALDYQRINYGGVKSVSNPSNNAAFLGATNGPGFGWSDVNVWKLGVEYTPNKTWTYRAGYNHGDNPIQSRDATFNMLAPGLVSDHLTLGLTYTTSSGGELTLSYMHAFEESVTGTSMMGGNDTINMYQDAIGIAYGWKM